MLAYAAVLTLAGADIGAWRGCLFCYPFARIFLLCACFEGIARLFNTHAGFSLFGFAARYFRAIFVLGFLYFVSLVLQYSMESIVQDGWLLVAQGIFIIITSLYYVVRACLVTALFSEETGNFYERALSLAYAHKMIFSSYVVLNIALFCCVTVLGIPYALELYPAWLVVGQDVLAVACAGCILNNRA